MMNVSQLEVLITRACNPTMGEPNYALHLEVADYINQKKANTYVNAHLSPATCDSSLPNPTYEPAISVRITYTRHA